VTMREGFPRERVESPFATPGKTRGALRDAGVPKAQTADGLRMGDKGRELGQNRLQARRRRPAVGARGN
jgi:hypothetical protein